MIAAGIDQSLIAAVRAPAGLNIGAVTPTEIALSILAELTQVKRGLFVKVAQNG
jgi:xanthine dehydrogenase accessory factor